jgi:hypothetical protein
MTHKRKGRPRKTTPAKPKTTTTGKRGRPAKNRAAEIDSYITVKKASKRPKKKSIIAIIKKVNISDKYDWSFLLGKRVQIKETPSWLPSTLYYGSIMESGYGSMDMAFEKDELEFINN